MIEIIYHDGTNAIPCPPGQTGGFENAEGNGEVHCYPLLDGVSAMLMRLEQAAVELVRSAKSVTQIAQNAGYDNASKFSECFKKRYGVTPTQYRVHAKSTSKRDSETKTE